MHLGVQERAWVHVVKFQCYYVFQKVDCHKIVWLCYAPSFGSYCMPVNIRKMIIRK